MISFLFGLFISSAFALDTCKLQNSFVQEINNIKKSTYSELDTSCRELEVGEQKNLRTIDFEDLSKSPQAYRIERVLKKEFKVHFNIKFRDSDDQNTERYMRQMDAYTYVWRKKANACLEKLGESIKGPNQEVLKFVVDESEESKTPISFIGLKAKGRANSGSWVKEMDCSSVVHELLHLTGLVDEYQETQVGFDRDPSGKLIWKDSGAKFAAYNCRKIGRLDSIMSNEFAAWDAAFSKLNLKTDFCQCGNDKEKCKSYFSEQERIYKLYVKPSANPTMPPDTSQIPENLKASTTTCPEGFVKAADLSCSTPVSTQEKNPEDLLKNNYASTFCVDFSKISAERWANGLLLIKNLEPRSESEKIPIIDERLWNVILYPGCMKKNWKYYEDAQNAYRTSVDHGGAGCINNNPN